MKSTYNLEPRKDIDKIITKVCKEMEIRDNKITKKKKEERLQKKFSFKK